MKCYLQCLYTKHMSRTSLVAVFSALPMFACLRWDNESPPTGRECLSPILNVIINRPVPVVVGVCSTSITVRWTAPQLLSPTCDDVFSFPPLLCTVFIADLIVNPFLVIPHVSNVGGVVGVVYCVPLLQVSTYLTELKVTTSTDYSISILAENLFSTRRNNNDHSTGNITSIALGTHTHMHIQSLITHFC